jgi:predicted RNase H-like HicB family nuclease
MNRTRHLTAVIEREDNAYVALCPELDIASQGGTIEEARANLVEAVELFFEAASDQEIAQRLRGEVYVTPIEVRVA